MAKKDNLLLGLIPQSVYRAHEADYLRRKAENPNAKRIRAQYNYIGPNREGKIESITYTITSKGTNAGYKPRRSTQATEATATRRARTPTLQDYVDALGPDAGPIAFKNEKIARRSLYKNRKEYQQIDHVVPVSKGGYTISTLMVPLETKLNLDKSEFLPTGLKGEIYEQTGFVEDDVVQTIRNIDRKRGEGTLATPEKMLEISQALAIAAQHQADFNFSNGLEAFLDQAKKFTGRVAAKNGRNLVPGVGTAMSAQDTAVSAQEFMEEPTLMNGAQTVTNGVATVANGVGDAALATGIGAPVAALSEKVSAGATAVGEVLQLIEDNVGGNKKEQEEEIDVPSGLSPRQREKARSMARRAAS